MPLKKLQTSIETARMVDLDANEVVELERTEEIFEGPNGERVRKYTVNSIMADGERITKVEEIGPRCGVCQKRTSARHVRRCAVCEMDLCTRCFCRFDDEAENYYCPRCYRRKDWKRLWGWLFRPVIGRE